MSIVPKQDGSKTKTAFMAKRLRRQQVNKRQKDKRTKRKWQSLLSDLMLRTTGIQIKPSRVKAKMIIGEDIIVKGIGAGIEFDIRITSKEK